MKNETAIMLEEWLQYAKDALESARIILEQTNNYHISLYHSHQAIEKAFKWFLLRSGQQFPFVHDLRELFKLACKISSINELLENILFVDNFYPQLRYPTGENITREEAQKALKIAENLLGRLTA